MTTEPASALTDFETPTNGDPVERAVRNILVHLGEDSGRDGLLATPRRVAKSLRFLTGGYRQDVDKVLNGALFDVCYDEMVIV